MHVCNGTLCNLCRARVLEMNLSSSDETTSTTSHRQIAAQAVMMQGLQQRGPNHPHARRVHSPSSSALSPEDKADLLKLLSEEGVSRSIKEQLHSKLLSSPLTKTSRAIASTPTPHLAHAPVCNKKKKKEKASDLRSRFSDSSDDDINTSSSAVKSKSRSTPIEEAIANHNTSTSRDHTLGTAGKPHHRHTYKRDDQEVFDLEI